MPLLVGLTVLARRGGVWRCLSSLLQRCVVGVKESPWGALGLSDLEGRRHITLLLCCHDLQRKVDRKGTWSVLLWWDWRSFLLSFASLRQLAGEEVGGKAKVETQHTFPWNAGWHVEGMPFFQTESLWGSKTLWHKLSNSLWAAVAVWYLVN